MAIEDPDRRSINHPTQTDNIHAPVTHHEYCHYPAINLRDAPSHNSTCASSPPEAMEQKQEENHEDRAAGLQRLICDLLLRNQQLRQSLELASARGRNEGYEP